MKKRSLFISGLFIASIFFISNVGASMECTTTCQYNGCSVSLVQTSSSYTLSASCDDGYSGSDSGSGDFTGTICGGVEPCNVPH
ncbi:MAG: hypothetical protein FH748_08905 [Balneolaceae bacterium]|nr:hypothetical protein [Balneolaceae bacterium]